MKSLDRSSKRWAMFFGFIGVAVLIGNIIYTIMQQQRFIGIWESIFAAAIPFYVAWYLKAKLWVYLVLLLLLIFSIGIYPYLLWK